MGVPRNRWMVYFMENPTRKWMMTGGTPMTQETTSHASFSQSEARATGEDPRILFHDQILPWF